MGRFINLTNHPSPKWSAPQRDAALALGDSIVDLPFPDVPVDADELWLRRMAGELAARIAPDDTVCVQGEFTLAFPVVAELQRKGTRCVAAATERDVVEGQDASGATIKTHRFVFRRFREYPRVG